MVDSRYTRCFLARIFRWKMFASEIDHFGLIGCKKVFCSVRILWPFEARFVRLGPEFVCACVCVCVCVCRAL